MDSHLQDFRCWLETEKGYSEHTVEGYLRDLHEFFSGLPENLELHLISTKDVRNFVVHLHGTNAPSSIARKLSALRTFFAFS